MSLRLFTLLTVLLTGGCAASNVQILQELTDESIIPPGHGMVVLQVADTTPTGRVYQINQVTFAAQDVNVTEAKLPRVQATEGYASSTSLFVTTLPANDYAITSLRSFYRVGDAYFSRFYPGDIELGTFTVAAGEVTDLGTIAVYIDRSAEDYLYASARVGVNEHGQSWVRDNLPSLATAVTNMDAPSSWHEDGNDFERDNDYRRAANRQLVFGLPHVKPDTGGLVYPGRLGMILRRDGPGAWALEGFEEDVELSMLTEVAGDTVIITEFNDIYRRTGADDDWQAVPPIPTEDRVTYINSHPDLGIYAVSQSANGVAIWTTTNFGGTWSQRNSLEPELGFFASLDKNLLGLDQSIKGATYLASETALFLVLRNSLYRYDLAANTFTDLKTSNVDSLQSRNAVLTVSSAGLFSSNRVSFDDGQSWTSYTGPLDPEYTPEQIEDLNKNPHKRKRTRRLKLIGHPIFLNENVGFGVHAARRNGDAFLVRTEDGAENWKRVDAPLPEGCLDLELANASELLLQCFLSGEFYRSTNEGMTWEIDREVSDT